MSEEHTKRDYAAERGIPRQSATWLIQVAYGLNTFELFQGVGHFVRETAEKIVDFLPHNYGGTNYVSDSLKFTRYRNYNKDVI